MAIYSQRPAPSFGERSEAEKLGVWFDGRHYRYKDFRYDRLADATAYAQLSGTAALSPADRNAIPAWQALAKPTEAEQTEMIRHDVSFDGIAYHVDSYRYDRLADAVRQAESRR